jgi:hypothetical protein
MLIRYVQLLVYVYARSMLTGDVCRDGVMRRGALSVRFAFRLVYDLHTDCSWFLL